MCQSPSAMSKALYTTSPHCLTAGHECDDEVLLVLTVDGHELRALQPAVVSSLPPRPLVIEQEVAVVAK